MGEEEDGPGINHSAKGRVKKLIKRDDQSVSLSSPQIISAKADDPKSEESEASNEPTDFVSFFTRPSQSN